MKKGALDINGFTLIELVLVVALLGLALIISTVNLFRPLPKAQANSSASGILSQLRATQNKAMNTVVGTGTVASDYGIHFEANRYILFKGSTFDASDPVNFVIDTLTNILLTPNLPCASPPSDCNNIVFEKISGEVVDFDGSTNSVCVTETSINKTVSLTVNFVGVVDVQEGC
ncbi:prepilin-type N-terminal cleavage/methylation domain-containing protein [Patescibacteria group bacterium]|nr:prepilin-type N-terminal cleavage/methylation domain-containing protein [Patescibacteria group bacterium]